MKRLLIINLHSTKNAGDHALLLMSLRKIYAFAPDTQVTLSANDPKGFVDSQLEETCVPSFFGWSGGGTDGQPLALLQRVWLLGRLYVCSLWAALVYRIFGRQRYTGIPKGYCSLVQAYFEADAILSCPGNFVYSRAYLAGLPILIPLFAMAYAWLLDKPLYILPQTLGPLKRRWEETALKWVLHRTKMIAVRDLTSVTLLGKLGFSRDDFQLIPDLAFQFPSAGKEVGAALLKRFGVEADLQRPILGVTLIDWGAQNPAFTRQDRYEAAVAETIRLFLEETSGQVLLFSQVCGPKAADDDRIPARRVAAALAGTSVADRVHTIDAAVPAEILKAAYAYMDLFVGSRLHSNIFALAEGVPVIAIAYQDKTVGVLGMLDMDEWVVRIEDVTSDSLPALYRQAWPQRAQLRGQVQSGVEALQRETDSQLEKLLFAILHDEAHQ